MAERSDQSIAGKVALVTGGGRGLGAATARALTAAGARVFVIDLHRPAAGEAIDERVTYLVGDVTDLGDMTRAAETVVRDAGRLDIVIANAGVLGRGVTLRASSPSVVDRLFDVNVGGALNTAVPPFQASSRTAVGSYWSRRCSRSSTGPAPSRTR
jgi:NAD(P)-dependent dehydrogenase (short-subunit alcohol dehydrogenase family)